MKFATIALLATLLYAGTLHAQTAEPIPSPKYELRSAWVATAAGLDWPRGTTPSAQETSLRNIIRRMKDNGMNAVVFQVVPRGDAYYQSERLPWSRRLTGTVGQDPGWDPLAVAVEEAHSLGMELHAWYNVFRIGDLNSPDVAETEEPKHVYFSNPEWTVTLGTSELWLNPGVPEAREWAIGNVMEIVRNYDVDAVHFDFIRYGASSYPGDLDLRDEHDPGMNISHWRRENVSRFAMAVHDSVKAEKPWVKVGSTPIGHYQQSGGWAANLAYFQVYQDSRRWLQEGKHDYLAPQIYWGIGSADDAPRFEWLVNDWMGENYDRHIYVGTAPYKSNVRAELGAQIDTTRAHGAHGQVHFRYDFVATSAAFQGRYDRLSLVPPMPWLDETAPPAPANLTYAWSTEDTTLVELTWDPVDDLDGAHRYAVYRVYSEGEPDFEEAIADPMNLIAVTGGTTATDRPGVHPTYYYVTTVSSNWVESESAPSVDLEGRATSSDREVASSFGLEQNYPNPFNPTTTITYTLDRAGDVSLRVYNVIGQQVAVLVDGQVPAGTHAARFDAADLPSGTYFYVLEAGERSVTRAMMLIK